MKLLNIGSDKNIFKPNADVAVRQARLGEIFDELHIIVFTKKSFSQLRLAPNVHVYPTNSLAKIFYYWDAYKLAKSILSSCDDDNWVVTVQDPYDSGPLGWFLKKRFKIPLQIQVHTDIFSPYFWQGSLANKIRTVIAKWTLAHADQIRVVTQRIKNSLINTVKVSPEKIIVLPVFVDVERYRQAAPTINLRQKYPEFNFIILMASRFSPEKNIPLAIRVFKKIAADFPHALLLIRGQGSEEKNLKMLAADCLNIQFEPWQDDIVSYYQTADLFWLTSNYEGFGMTVVEAMASGLPVIMTDVGLANELLINRINGIVVPINEEQSLYEATRSLIKDEQERRRLAEAGHQTATQLPNQQDYLKLVDSSFKKLNACNS